MVALETGFGVIFLALNAALLLVLGVIDGALGVEAVLVLPVLPNSTDADRFSERPDTDPAVVEGRTDVCDAAREGGSGLFFDCVLARNEEGGGV